MAHQLPWTAISSSSTFAKAETREPSQEDSPILSSIDPYDNAMEQVQNPPIPEFIFYIYDHLDERTISDEGGIEKIYHLNKLSLMH